MRHSVYSLCPPLVKLYECVLELCSTPDVEALLMIIMIAESTWSALLPRFAVPCFRSLYPTSIYLPTVM